MLRNCSRQKTIFSCCDFDSEEEEKSKRKKKIRRKTKKKTEKASLSPARAVRACDEEMTRIAAFLQQSKS